MGGLNRAMDSRDPRSNDRLRLMFCGRILASLGSMILRLILTIWISTRLLMRLGQNLTQIVAIASESRWGRRKKEPSSVPLTLIASILSTRRAKQSKQETLVYTCTLVVSRRVISILQELRVIDCYRTILRTVQGIAANTEGRQSINLF